ncbi:MAG TPA: DNA polymerase sliding clamp [Thermoplasmata archaeon]|nr:DNA polymerase sliding clamp [Thermoplasmata archaeon]
MDMFEVVAKSGVLKETFKILGTLLNEVKLVVSPESIKVRAVDPSHVAMVDLELTKDAFEEYKATDLEIALDINKLTEFLNIAAHNEKISLTYDEEMNALFASIGALKRKLSLLDPTEIKFQKMPQLQLENFVEVGIKSLKRGIKAAKEVGTYLTITLNGEGVEFFSKGDIDSVSLKLTKDMCEEIHAVEKAKSVFSLKYFEKLISSVPDSSETVRIWIGNDIPVKAEFKIAEEKGSVIYLLAPRIMDSD